MLNIQVPCVSRLVKQTYCIGATHALIQHQQCPSVHVACGAYLPVIPVNLYALPHTQCAHGVCSANDLQSQSYRPT